LTNIKLLLSASRSDAVGRIRHRTRWHATLLAILTGGLLAGCGPTPEPPPVADSWSRIDADGEPVAAGAGGAHQCVFDARTGLLWEIKQAAPGAQDRDALYSWYFESREYSMGESGTMDGGACSIARCDTSGLIEQVNQNGLCGHRDWRLPLREELLTLGDQRLVETGQVLDPAFFPFDRAGEYWTGSTFRLYPDAAWLVDSRTGLDRAERKTEARFVRLVRGEVFNPRRPQSD